MEYWSGYFGLCFKHEQFLTKKFQFLNLLKYFLSTCRINIFNSINVHPIVTRFFKFFLRNSVLKNWILIFKMYMQRRSKFFHGNPILLHKLYYFIGEVWAGHGMTVTLMHLGRQHYPVSILIFNKKHREHKLCNLSNFAYN